MCLSCTNREGAKTKRNGDEEDRGGSLVNADNEQKQKKRARWGFSHLLLVLRHHWYIQYDDIQNEMIHAYGKVWYDMICYEHDSKWLYDKQKKVWYHPQLAHSSRYIMFHGTPTRCCLGYRYHWWLTIREWILLWRILVGAGAYAASSTTAIQQRSHNNPVNMEHVAAPIAVQQYRHNMNGVDRFAFMLSRYECDFKTRKWWIRVLWYVFDMSIVNAYIMYIFPSCSTPLSTHQTFSYCIGPAAHS